MKATGQSFQLKFKHPFTISKGTKTHQPTFIVTLEHFGITGYGEAPSIAYYNVTPELLEADFKKYQPFIEKFAFTDPDRFWHFLHHLIPHNPFLVCALDMAAWDIWGKMNRKPLYELWKGDISKNPLCDFTIGIDTVDKMVEKMKEKPWPIYKIKLGTPDDIAIIKAMRQQSDALIRVDANAGWTVETALKILPELEALGIELIEQPLAKDDFEGMLQLMQATAIPLIADESCVFEKDVAKCNGYFTGINIKLTKCSGITPALRMIQQTCKQNMKIMVGSMNESTIGSAAIAHLLPFVDFADLDGPLLQTDDLATGIDFDNGKVMYSGLPGLGIEYKGFFSRG